MKMREKLGREEGGREEEKEELIPGKKDKRTRKMSIKSEVEDNDEKR